jgi:hypothetical protein
MQAGDGKTEKTMDTRFGMLVAMLIATGAATAATAHGGREGGFGGRGGFDFAALDADADGSVTSAELNARAIERIAIVDADGDGTITRAELVSSMPAWPSGLRGMFAGDRAGRQADRMLERMGAEGDQIEAATLADRIVERMIVRMDRDGDGAISRTEAESGHRIGRPDGEGRKGMGRRHD